MRAALIKAFGEPTEVLELSDVPEPSGPAPGEVLVGVEYAPINMNDLHVIQEGRTGNAMRASAVSWRLGAAWSI
jgi:NADPH:quinone reductase-like Zn-dependent oxidoreductase